MTKDSRRVKKGKSNEIRQWFADHPDEMLSYADIGVKFGLNVQQVCRTLDYLRAEDAICSGRMVWANPDRERSEQCES